MDVTVIIPAYNASATISAALNALAAQDVPGRMEVIVVDDGSSDGTAAAVARFPGVACVRQANAGPAAARNHGARLAKAPLLCFTDADCVPRPDWVRGLCAGFAAPDIGVVAGSYGIANPQSPLAAGIHAEIQYRHRTLMPEFPKAFGSYNFCVRRDVFERVGGFHEGYRQASGEDNDLSYKILKAGYRIRFLPGVKVDHYHTSAPGKYLREQFRHGFWRVKMYADHPQMAAGDDYTFWKDIVEVGAALAVTMAFLGGFAGLVSWPVVFGLCVLPLLALEFFFGCVMLQKFWPGIFFGYIMFLRAFARAFGLSTGIFYFFARKWQKKVK